ncbi:hypothetical protein GO279_04508 [Ralstonia solanacearum]|nr:hypothetical protein [Ralstonia solanacearum]NKA67704.1 hypothetical protein [Ralstonia solanacearum]NKA85998.1 hypothetical protein [Ralstonia solanacearum]NKF57679.1 hypothetical protein [Ralstonia solanacearum]NKF62606.1 hypothetical protein [Ralstonia solanacearum]
MYYSDQCDLLPLNWAHLNLIFSIDNRVIRIAVSVYGKFIINQMVTTGFQRVPIWRSVMSNYPEHPISRGPGEPLKK